MKYKLICLNCKKTYSENEYICRCKKGCNSIIRTIYQKKKLEINNKYQGIWKYFNWLPIKTIDPKLIRFTSSFLTYKSKALAQFLGLKNLIITLNSYPKMKTGSFKDIEAEISFQRLLNTKDKGKIFVLSSDGNNAISFIYYSRILNYPIVLFVTEDARKKRVWSYKKDNPNVRLFSVEGDYSDAISLAKTFGRTKGYLPEGGAFNIARRDGVGTIILDAARFIGHIPDHYFQALGSGPGAVAAYEAAIRLIDDGRFGKKPPKIHGSQNYPFVPMYDAWKNDSRDIDKKFQNEEAKKIIDKTYAHVLSNRFPIYSLKGGVYDTLKSTDGEFYSVKNEEAKKAQVLFKKYEKISIVPEAGITIASLVKAIKTEKIGKDDYILVNITGGGRDEMQRKKYLLEPSSLFKIK